jgi:N-acetylmuramic acid 6-phosphate etherase
MVDLRAASDKLTTRSRKILIDLLDIDYDQADRLLHDADGSVKLAIVMHRLGLDKDDAQARLAEAGGKLWKLLDK